MSTPTKPGSEADFSRLEMLTFWFILNLFSLGFGMLLAGEKLAVSAALNPVQQFMLLLAIASLLVLLLVLAKPESRKLASAALLYMKVSSLLGLGMGIGISLLRWLG